MSPAERDEPAARPSEHAAPDEAIAVDDAGPSFEVVEDRVLHKRYLTTYNRVVRFGSGPEARLVEYDVIGHPQCDFSYAVAVPFHPAAGGRPAQVTVIREYAQGPNCLQYCLPTGGFDPRKHGNLLDCARAEMREESMLVGGEVVELMPGDHPGQFEVKWCRNRFRAYLFVDPQPDPSGHAARDAEEHTIEVSRISISELKALALQGRMMMPSALTTFLALEALAARGLLG
ncbi:hypothetical protein HYH03_002427 [Edaphochlamys debaryana]|uniref:Nudix hydrolase domain-containing protein n=1 Tax=Edaphochlamys debaryana TaxID=47281 RepID=A0A836C447_9CHLO|nr:hypothetical protein HYH03_002427 [Edaphochlamys debaryana]|eukprot:KAG2499480.1 hypothetical protein HYH03_002427 [Edaphochlamys debaryana]